MKLEKLTKEEAAKLYQMKCLTIEQLALLCGKTVQTISQWIKFYQVNQRNLIDEQEIAELKNKVSNIEKENNLLRKTVVLLQEKI